MSPPRSGSKSASREPLGLRQAAGVRSLAAVGIAIGLLVAAGFIAVPAWIVATVIACCSNRIPPHLRQPSTTRYLLPRFVLGRSI